MEFTNDFFIQAQGVIERVFRSERDKLVKASGSIAHEFKEDKTVVTKHDREVESKLRDALKEFDSSIGIEGEEFGIEGSRETYWLIDPIDGTEHFIRGGSQFRNMATLIDGGKPLFTVIYRPVTDDLFVAAEGEGSYLNGIIIKMVERPLKRARLDMHSPGSDPNNWSLMQRLSEHIDAVLISADFLNVAKGELDAYLVSKSGKGGPWDFAPRALIIKEAGGWVANLGSDKYDYRQNDMLAAHPANFDALMNIITGS